MKHGRYTVELSPAGEPEMVAAGTVESRAMEVLQRRYVKLLETHERNEAKLARVMRAWDKSRAALRRAEKRLDKRWVATANATSEPPAFDGEV